MILPCIAEFGEHDDHDECDYIMSLINTPDYGPDERFNSTDEFGITSWVD